ncbi:hypothetical protein ABG808_09860 [Streptococcus iniae]
MTSVSAQEVTENQEALAQLETNAVTTPDFDSQLKTFEEQGFEIEKTVLEVSYEKGNCKLYKRTIKTIIAYNWQG